MSQLKPTLLCFLVLLFVSSQAVAQEQDKKKNKLEGKLVKNIMRPFNKAELTDEQKEKAKEVISSSLEKIKALQKEQNEIISDEQKKLRKGAMAKGKEEGLKGKKLNEFVFKEMNLDEDDIKNFKAKAKEINQARLSIQKEVFSMLSDEQKEKVKSRQIKGGKRKGKNKKKKKDDDTQEKKSDDGDGGK